MSKETNPQPSPINPEINPHLLKVRQIDWPIKVFYALTRKLKETTNESILDIGSSIEVEPEDLSLIKKVIETGYKQSLKANHYTEYPSSWGQPLLRQNIAGFFETIGVDQLDPITEVMVTGGIINTVDMAIQALDITHVIIPSLAPYFATSLATLRGKQVIYLPLDLDTGNYDLDNLENQLNSHSVSPQKTLMYLTLPSSPAGTLPNSSFISNQLIPFAINHQIPIISDTYAYATTFENKPIQPLLSHSKAKSIAIEAITVSKEIGLPGIRIGGVAGNENLINALRLYAASALIMQPNPNQHLAALALDNISPQAIGEKLALSLNSDILPRLDSMNWPYIKPQAGLDMLVEIPHHFQNISELDPSLLASIQLLYHYKVAFCPASVFGPTGKKYLRIVIKQANHKVARALDKLIQAGFNWETEKPDPKITQETQELINSLDLTKL